MEDAVVEFNVGDHVNVDARTFPGMNKQGGQGKIVKIHEDGLVDVKLVLGGRDNKVERKWVHKIDSNQDESSNARPRRKSSSPTTVEKMEEEEEEEQAAVEQQQHKVAQPEPMEVEETVEKVKSPFNIGQVVDVASRTFPGMNKPGGTGRVTKINEDGTLNIKYVLGGSEKKVELKWVAAPEEDLGKREAAPKEKISEEPVIIGEVPKTVRRAKKQPMKTIDPNSCRNSSTGDGEVAKKRKTVCKKPKVVPTKKPQLPKPAAPVEEIILEPAQVFRTCDPREMARAQSFRQMVAKIFQNMGCDQLMGQKLLELVNVENMENEPFTEEEFRKRLSALDSENRVLVREGASGQLTVWII